MSFGCVENSVQHGCKPLLLVVRESSASPDPDRVARARFVLELALPHFIVHDLAPMTPQQFITKWQRVQLSERSASQQHFLDLCELLERPSPPRPIRTARSTPSSVA